MSIRNGDDFIGKPKDFAEKMFAEFNQKHYHQPSDEFRDDWRFDGMVQVLETSLAIGLRASNAAQMPRFNAGDEFARAQPSRK